jgi:hypothetical protein
MKVRCAFLIGASVSLATLKALADDAQGPSKPPVIAPEDVPPSEPAQPRPKRTANNSIFIEGLGNGGLYSVNYERILGDTNFSLRAGFGYFRIDGGTTFGFANAPETDLLFPVLANYYVGETSHKLQLGAGALFWHRSISWASSAGHEETLETAATLVLGYRYLPRDGGFNFGVGFTPMIGDGGFFPHFLPWGGLSMGGGF